MTPARPAPNAPPNFDRVAAVYRWCEYLLLGPSLQRTRMHFLPRLNRCGNALVLGDGDGRFTAALLASNRLLRVLAVDSSASMLRLLERRCRFAQPRLRACRMDVRTLPPHHAAGPFDLIATHFLLDCLTQPEVESLIARVTPSLAPGALWVLSEFRLPPGPLRPLARRYVRSLYLAFRLLTGLRTQVLPDYTRALRKAGFVPVSRHRTLFGLLSAELWQLTLPALRRLS